MSNASALGKEREVRGDNKDRRKMKRRWWPGQRLRFIDEKQESELKYKIGLLNLSVLVGGVFNDSS